MFEGVLWENFNSIENIKAQKALRQKDKKDMYIMKHK